MITRPEESDEDRDSLFGSPPPSPRRTGRASPTLALPSTGSSGSRASTSTAPATQNVGTIALPGSHPDSELPINPLALSLNHGIVHRPPAQLPAIVNVMVPNFQQRNNGQRLASSSQSLITPTVASSSKSQTKKRTKQSSRSSKESTPQPRGPEFALPDPSAPPPTHFLRNQENLLGKAGLVAGVKPSTLTHVRGSTPSNPILVDEDDTPRLGRRRSHSRELNQPYIDPALLTAPTNQEIVSVLIGQKDIFPILEGVLKLVVGNVSGTVPPAPTGFERRRPIESTDSAYGQTVKKRKLNRVPAGASDWDVPYPFQQGEGPEAYHKTWERERGKQLISQLIKLIKSAARKAATKKYLQQEKERQDVEEKACQQNRMPDGSNANRRNSYYKPETATYGIDIGSSTQTLNQVHDVLQDSSNASRTLNFFQGNPSQSSNTPSPQVEEVGATRHLTFEEMLISCTPQDLPSCSTTELEGFPDLPNPFSGSTDLQTSATGLDTASFDSWMNFFVDTFPVSFDGSSNPSLDSNPASHCSTPAPDDFTFANLFHQPTLGDTVVDPSSSVAPFDLAAMISSILNQPQTQTSSTDAISGIPTSIADQMIDPSLLALSSTSNANLNKSFMDSATPPIIQAASPIASTSSYSGNDPATPASANWDMSLPDVFMANADGDISGQGWDTNGGITMDTPHGFGFLPEVTDSVLGLGGTTTIDKGKGRAVDPVSTAVVTAPPSVMAPKDAVCTLLGDSPATFNPPSSTSTTLDPARATRKLRKDDIVKRAQVKRQRLQDELNKIKMQLWETTIEQAGLVQLVRQLDGVTTEGSEGRVS